MDQPDYALHTDTKAHKTIDLPLDTSAFPPSDTTLRPVTAKPNGDAPRKRLTADDIERAQKRLTEDVYIEEWGGFITMQGLTSVERDAFESSMRRRRKSGRIDVVTDNVRAKLVCLCAVDEQGNRLFSTQDEAWLGKQAAAPINKLYEVGSRLSGMSQADTDELEGN